MKKLSYILSFIICLVFVLTGCTKVEPLKPVVCVEQLTSEDSKDNPTDNNNTETTNDITDSEDDDDQDKDINSN